MRNAARLIAGWLGTGRDPGERTGPAQRAGGALLVNLAGLGTELSLSERGGCCVTVD